MKKWVWRGAMALMAVALLGAFSLWVYARRALPQTEGALRVAGPASEIRIERDEHGIPTLHAASERDAMFGLGFVHAQDRLWQLETHRRIAAGRLAEAFGEGALDTDRFLRALGVRRAAAAQWAQMQAAGHSEARDALLAYTAGVNAFLHQHLRARPPEFVILGIEPEDWTPVDSLAWGIMMAWDLGANWTTELLRMRLARKLPVERINELMPPYPGEKPLPTVDYAALFRSLQGDGHVADAALDRLLAAAPSSGLEGEGSNNWVVAGAHTDSGKPLLANDPHLKLSAPALWYFARIDAPGLQVAGATLPGVPMVVLGQNQHIAWGFTNTGPDVQDLYLERLKPDDGSQYQTPEGWAKFDVVEETLKIKGRPELKIRVRTTRHGPVISDAGISDDLIGPKGRPAYAVAMRWTALDADADSVGVGLAFNHAASMQEFVRASRGWVAPMQNMVVADDQGHIGFVAPGRVPLRKPENDLKGLVPAPGWDARYDWAGWVPADETPREFDPPRGFIATANQRVTAPEYRHFLTSEWAPPFRQQRIEELLRARERHSVDSLAAMQADVKSLAAVPLLPWLAKASSSHPLAAQARQALQGFDGTMDADRAAPLIYWAWLRQLTQGVFADEVGTPLYERSLGGRSYRDALEAVLERNDTWWCDDKNTPDVVETCAAQVDAALTRALEELQARFGSDVSQWRWGDAHQARSEHRPFSRVKVLARFYELRAPVGGDTYTINVSRVNYRPDATTGELYLDEHGPSLRAIYDVGDLSRSRFMHSSGQSGIPWSPLYRSFVPRWAKVEYVPVWAGAPEHTLTLTPQHP
ncbi:MAG: penicillin acylase family protein [Betaproteobacteria bacterium]|nr:MAG: penicillin acylase family protein [Betaproteobacteria bacterium]